MDDYEDCKITFKRCVSTTTLFTSCYTEVIVDDIVDEPIINVNQVLNSHELWYVDINANYRSW